MDKTDFNIMFTCAGRRVALLQAFRAAMAEVGAVYDVVPVPRGPEDVMGSGEAAAPVSA